MNFSAIKVFGAVLSLLFSAALACAQTTPTVQILPVYADSSQVTESAISLPPLPVFDDFIRAGWTLNPIGGPITVNTAETKIVRTGRSISCLITTNQPSVLQFTSSPYFHTTPYESLSFWIHGGTPIANDPRDTISVSLARQGVINPPKVLIAKPQPNTWTRHTISLRDLGAENSTTVSALKFESAQSQPVFYLDDIQFERPSAYSLTYSGNGHTGGTVPVAAGSPYVPGSTATIVGNAGNLTRGANYNFLGWNTAANGTGTNYAAGASFAIAQATTLYAKWIPSVARYTVVYEGNGQLAGAAPIDYASPRPINDVVIIADKASLTQGRAPFRSWNTAADGTGTRYFPGDRVQITANLTLYAQYGAFLYPYEPYNQLKMDPQLYGWPLTPEAHDYVVNNSEVDRRPGRETTPPFQKMAFFSVTPVAGNWGTANGADPAAWLDTHAAQVAKVAATPNAEILLVGDSITSQWGGGQMPTITPAWTAHFGTTPFVNLGIGGDKTYNVLWRLDHAGLETLNPKAVVLQIGHNNMFFVGEYSIADAVDGIVWCVRNLRSKFSTTPIIVVNVFPTLGPFYNVLKETRAALNARKLAATDPLVFELDLWDQLNLPPPGLGNPLYFKPLSTNPALNDGVHLFDAGYQVWAAALKPLINAINAPTVRYDANGASSGTVPSDATVYTNRATVTVRANSGNLSKMGHTFTGWNTRPDGSGTHYLANATFPITAPTTLYATWVPSSTVRFTRNLLDTNSKPIPLPPGGVSEF